MLGDKQVKHDPASYFKKVPLLFLNDPILSGSIGTRSFMDNIMRVIVMFKHIGVYSKTLSDLKTLI